MRRRWILRLWLAGGLISLAWGGSWTWAAWRFQTGLKQAKADLTAGRFESARRWLAAQSPGGPERSEAVYLLGVCEQALGRPEAALEAYGRMPASAVWGAQASLARARILIDDLGRFTQAEEVLSQAPIDSGRNPAAARMRYVFNQLLYWEGRLDEMRRILQEGWNRSPDQRGDLHDLWRIDNAPLAIEKIHSSVETAARRAPQDDRVWLARAHLAMEAGRFSEAARWLGACSERRPEDPVVWRARLRLAQATDRLDDARRCLQHLPADRFAETEVLLLRAWFAGREGPLVEERIALEQLIDRVPGHLPALERLAVLAVKSGHFERAAELRRRKAAADRAKERYYRILEGGRPVTQFAELGALAEALGRGFEARCWWLLAAQKQPSDSVAAAALARLGPPRPDPRPSAGRTVAALLAAADATSGNARPAHAPSRSFSRSPGAAHVPAFRDDAGLAGLRFVFENGRSALCQLPETTSGGIGLFDYDGDGWLDVDAVQGGPFPPDPARPSSGDRLFRNRGDGTFEDVTGPSGISRLARGYGHGVAIGDFDNDGHADLFLTRWRCYALFRNRGDGTFEDVTERSGLGGDHDWPTSVALADFDGDGELDIYVCHYLVWDSEHPSLCPRRAEAGEVNDRERRYDYCMPNPFPSRPDHLYRNDGGRFVDVTAEAGIIDRDGRGLGVVAVDLDDDGRVDLFVANDTSANYLFRNIGKLRFAERAAAAGVACNAAGAFQAGMGTAAGDLDGDTLPDLFVTNFYGESTTFFQNLGSGAFADRSSEVGLAAASRYLLGFGIVLLDANNDGRLDVAQTNGHVVDLRPSAPLEMPGMLVIAGDDGRLVDVTTAAGACWTARRLGRGLAAGDLDNDGRIDLVALHQNGPLVYLHNQTDGGHFLTILLEGTESNRDAVGAVVTVTAGGRRRRAWRYGGGSYQSASDPRIHFGLGGDAIEAVEIRWPSGRVDQLAHLELDRGYRVREGDRTPRLLPGFGHR
jgi:tetratricopeptide (TPR) repeat protein